NLNAVYINLIDIYNYFCTELAFWVGFQQKSDFFSKKCCGGAIFPMFFVYIRMKSGEDFIGYHEWTLMFCKIND
ncbi:hypothetical protein, partial [Pradoshia sp.]